MLCAFRCHRFIAVYKFDPTTYDSVSFFFVSIPFCVVDTKNKGELTIALSPSIVLELNHTCDDVSATAFRHRKSDGDSIVVMGTKIRQNWRHIG